MEQSIKLDNGKYEVISHEDGKLVCLRNGREWRDLTGDNVILHMLYKIKIMEDGWDEMKRKLPPELIGEFAEFFED